MKKLLFIVAVIALSSCGKEKMHRMTVVRDCTGTYLRYDEKDYHVCNADKLASFEEGETVKATYKKISLCDNYAATHVVCEMYHAHEGWITVVEVK